MLLNTDAHLEMKGAMVCGLGTEMGNSLEKGQWLFGAVGSAGASAGTWVSYQILFISSNSGKLLDISVP